MRGSLSKQIGSSKKKAVRNNDRCSLLLSIVGALYPFRKFFNSFFPSTVKIDSGWNCTPQIG